MRVGITGVVFSVVERLGNKTKRRREATPESLHIRNPQSPWWAGKSEATKTRNAHGARISTWVLERKKRRLWFLTFKFEYRERQKVVCESALHDA